MSETVDQLDECYRWRYFVVDLTVDEDICDQRLWVISEYNEETKMITVSSCDSSAMNFDTPYKAHEYAEFMGLDKGEYALYVAYC